MPNLLGKYKSIYLEKIGKNLETFQKLLPHIGVTFKLDLEFVKSLIRIF